MHIFLINRPICQIFNSSIIQQGYVPSLWKCADVTPIPKVSKPESIENDLRPISLTAVISKLLEGFVFKWLSQIVLPQLHPCQFGGIKDSSATHLLVRLIHEWLLATAESPKTFVRSCLVDFSKAFDRIDRNILIGKLRDISLKLVCRFFEKSFSAYKNRTREVILESYTRWSPSSYQIETSPISCNGKRFVTSFAYV